MSTRDVRKPRAPRGHFPRPNLTMRELIGLVVAFAVSNAFLTWMNPEASRHFILFAFWNGLLAFYLGFAFFQAYLRSILRWIRTGDASPAERRPRRWTALGVAEATVIGGTMIWCVLLLLNLSGGWNVHGDDWTAPIAILAIGSASAIMVLRMWRREPAASLTGGEVRRTIE